MTSTRRAILTAAVLFATTATHGTAQVADKKVLTLEGAKKVAAAAAADARAHGEGSAIAVVDDGGNLMYLERLDGTFAAGARISIGKARTAALFKKPTAAFEDIITITRNSATGSTRSAKCCASCTMTIVATAAPDARPSRRSRSRSSPTTPTRSALISGTRRWRCWGTRTAAASRCSTRCAIPAT